MGTTKCINLESWYWPVIDQRRLWIPRFDFGIGRYGAVVVLTTFRWVFGIYFLISMIMDGNKWFFTYLTLCGALLNTSYLIGAAALGTTALVCRDLNKHGSKIEFKNDKSPIKYPDFLYFHAIRLIQHLYAISLSFEVVICVLYWALLWPLKPNVADPSYYLYQNVDIHGLTALIAVVELIIGDHRVSFHDRFSITVLAASIIYAIINAISSVAHAPVYPILTWTKPSDALLVIGVIAFVILVFFVGSLITWGMDECLSRCFGQKKPSIPPTLPNKPEVSLDWLAETEELSDAALSHYFIPCTSCCRCTEAATGPDIVPKNDNESVGASKPEQV